MALFSQDLNKLQELEDQYRKELADYEAVLTRYKTLLDRDPNDSQLADLYGQVEQKNTKLQETYAELEGLRRSFSPTPRSLPS